ncbi:MAG: hypothetical protein JSR37_09385 [Verrucomicrobia bacterium]|nr:hypothetical protein [Verrucomicrobiota bacterium]MBS0636582.1 hypothetical protein [Verrucomicrobiota bacterium]
MAVTILSCYFLPFLFFFITQIAFPKSILGCVLGVAALSISSLILYFQAIPKTQIKYIEKPEPTVQKMAPQPKKPAAVIDPIVTTALVSFNRHPDYSLKALIEEKDQALLSQKGLFTEELEKKNQALHELQMALQEKEALLASQTKELEDAKFELYTLLRIESYASTAASL